MSEPSDTASVHDFPLTASQQQIWAGQQLNPDSPLYNMAMACSINGELDQERFTTAWDILSRTADSLHIVMVEKGHELRQACTLTDLPLTLVDFTTHACPDKAAHEWMTECVATSFVLTKSLVQVALIKLSPQSWIFFCNQHHLTTDAASFGVLWRQLAALYSDVSVGLNCGSYQAYVTQSPSDSASQIERDDALRRYEEIPDKNGIREYWLSRAQSVPLRLYAGNTRALTTCATRETAILSESRAESLKQLAATRQALAITPHLSQYHVLLTVLFAYLYRVSGQSELSVDTPASNRTSSTMRNTPGLFIEMLPVCVSMDPAETFGSLMAKVRKEVHTFLQNSRPGACSWISNRGQSVVLNYVPVNVSDFAGMPVATHWVSSGHMDKHHIIRMQVTDWNNSGLVSIDLDFNDACFDSAQRKAATGHWQSLFDAMAKDIDTEIENVDIAGSSSGAEGSVKKSAIDPHSSHGVASFRENDHTVTRISSLLDRFDLVAARYAHDPAASLLETSITYAELNSRANALAERLRERGKSSGLRVAIYLDRSLALPVCLIGTLKSGSTYIPIEPDHPLERVRFLLQDSDADLIITTANLASNPGSQTECLIVDDNGVLQGTDSAALDSTPHGADLQQPRPLRKKCGRIDIAYCLYTSGSTGQPKGVEISHPALWNYCSWAVEHYAKGQRLVFPLFTPLSFDLTVTSLFVPLLSGGSIRIYPQKNRSVDDTLLEVLTENAVDVIKLTPAHLSMMQNHDLRASCVKQLIVGGEDLKRVLAMKIHQAFGGDVLIHNEYGPTEATVGCIVHSFEPAQDIDESVPIGVPIAGMSAHVLNARMLAQPTGVAGELYLSGPSLAEGYWHQPGLTQERFLRNPALNDEILYKTGDLVRINSSGNLVYLGRCDDQIKIRGVRIELSEIESAALAHPSVNACVVTRAEQQADEPAGEERFCIRCGLSSRNPESTLNTQDVCSLCIGYEQYESRAQTYFKPMTELESMAASIKEKSVGSHDCMMLLSGGKDSTYALARLVDLGLNVLAYTLDNGYLSNEAMANMTRVCNALGVDHEFGKTPAMPEIFVDSLKRHSNVCNGCFKTIYTLSMKRAQELKISHIFTGLSRGQFFETRLTGEIFTTPDIDMEQIDDTVLSARKAYHRVPDAALELLDTSHFQNDSIFDKVRIMDFYRYCPVELDDMLEYLHTRLPWVRPNDTGRSTNCLINDVGIYVHQKERGYHNYALPYSWDVRLGHKQRDSALEELDDSIDETRVKMILDELGYEPVIRSEYNESRLVLHFTSNPSLEPDALRQWMADKLPARMLPGWLMPVETMPLNENGKILKSALPPPTATRSTGGVEYVEPESEIEIALARLWSKYLKLDKVGTQDNFFESGGDSLLAIRIAVELRQQGYPLKTSGLFEKQTIAKVAELVLEAASTTQPGDVPENTEAARTPVAAFASLKPGQLEKLSNLLRNK